MSDVDIRTPKRFGESKIQLEEQQKVQKADFRDAGWQHVVYPNRSSIFKPYKSASLFEIVIAIVGTLFGIIAIFRLFFVSDGQRTLADMFTFVIFFGLLTIVLITASIVLLARAQKYRNESSIHILPNGIPVSIDTIMSNYRNLDDRIFDQTGYFDVEMGRAQNPIVAPGEINWNYSPSNTYAPSNMPKDGDDDVLAQMLDIMPDDSTTAELPPVVNFFEHVDAREPGHIITGIQESGELVQAPILKMFNHLVGGSVGSGKSIYLRSLVYQLMAEADDSDIPLELALADIENNTFPEFRGCRHVRWYAGNYVEIEHMTAELLREVERRKEAYEMLSSTPKDIERYNTLAGREGAPELPIIVVLYDEFSALMHRSQAQQKRILSDLLQLALRARKYGIFLVIAGQTFKADLIDSAVLGQFNVNVAFRVRSHAISQSIIGQPGAEHLKQPGEALMRNRDGTITHIQGLHIDDDELLDALEQFKEKDKGKAIPEMVKVIIEYAHASMEDQVKFRELELYLRDKGVSRADMMHYIDWMDEHKFTIRGQKNKRLLNWKVIRNE